MLSNLATAPWVIIPKPNAQANLRLFCFPYGGGGAFIYRTWWNNLPAGIEVCSIQLPGRETRLRETPFTRIEPLAQALAQAIIPYLNKPFAFFGHSMGTLVSFELARQLRKAYDLTPVHLFMSGRRAPQVPDTDPPTYDLPEPEFLEELRRLNGTPKQVLEHEELMQLALPILRADFAACQTYVYRHEPPLSCPITALGGLADSEVSREQLAAWRDQTTAHFSLRMFPGDHFYLHSSEQLLLWTLSLELHQILNTRLTIARRPGRELVAGR